MRKTLNPVNRVFYFCIIFLFLRIPLAHAADEFVIKSANTQLDDSVYFLNAVLDIHLPDYIVNSFEHGIVLPLVMEIEISKERAFWFDQDIVVIKQQYQIQNHALLDSVSLKNINSGSRLYFSSLQETLNYLTVLLEFPLLDNNALNPSGHYRGRLKFGIDVAELPVPLKSSSLWQHDWDLSSDWFEWDITH